MKILYMLPLFGLLHAGLMQAGSVVYDMGLRRATSLDYLNPSLEFPFVFSSAVFGLKRNTEVWQDDWRYKDRRHEVGAIFDAQYGTTEGCWFGLRTAFAREETKVTISEEDYLGIAGTIRDELDTAYKGFDDLLVNFGYIFERTEKSYLNLYGLVGIPLHADWNFADLAEPLVGSEHVSVGGGFDAACVLLDRRELAMQGILQGRCVHFFEHDSAYPINRSVGYDIETFERYGHIKTSWNLLDVLVALRFSGSVHAFEIGYNPTIPVAQKLKDITESEDDVNDASLAEQVKHEHNFVGKVNHQIYAHYTWTCPCDTYGLYLDLGGAFGINKQDDDTIWRAWISGGVTF